MYKERLPAQAPRGFFRGLDVDVIVQIVRIHQQRDQPGTRSEFTQEFQTLRH